MWLNSKTKVAVVFTAIGVAVLWASRHRVADSGTIPIISKSADDDERPTNPGAGSQAEHPSRKSTYDKQVSSWFTFATIVMLIGLTVYLSPSGPSLSSEITFLMAMALTAFMLRGPSARHRPVAQVALFAIFALELAAAVTATVNGFEASTDAVFILKLTIFSVLAISIATCAVATWLSFWRFTESFAVGFVAISIGALCYPGLTFLTETISAPIATGSAMLFATGKANQSLLLSVEVNGSLDINGSQSPPYLEDFTISNGGTRPVRWTLLVTGPARLKTKGPGAIFYHVTYPVRVKTLSASGVALNSFPNDSMAELFSGHLSAGSLATITGQPDGTFANFTSDRIAVSLPAYGSGLLAFLDRSTARAIISALRSKPVYRRSADFVATISSGPISSLDSITSDSLTPTQNYLPNDLTWTIHGFKSIDYTTMNQAAADDSSDLFFVFAVLLGVAGAALIGSLQAIIHQLTMAKGRKGEHQPSSG